MQFLWCMSCFKQICPKFLGLNKAENFKDVVANLLYSYDVIGCKMLLKENFLEFHLNFFHKNLYVSDEYSKKFHQDVAIIEKRF